METKVNPQPKKKRTLAGKIANVFSYILVSLVFLILILVLLLQTSPVQNFARGKVQNFLQKKLKTRVEIGKLNINFPNSVLLKNVYIEDQTKDTLLSGGLLKVDISMLLLLKNEIQIKEINFKDITAKIKRVGTDTVFNFQFIADAFMGDQTKVSEKQDTSALKMDIDNFIIDNSRIVYKDVLTGNDLNLYIGHLDAPIETFDINRLYFDIPTFTVTGLKGYFYQNEPLKAKIEEAVAEAVTAPGNFLQLRNKEILFKDIDFVFKSAPTAISAGFKFASLTAHPDTLNLKDGKFDFKDLALERSDIDIQMSNKKAPPVTAKQLEIKDSIPPFTITADAISISESNFKMNNTSMPVLKDGMDFGHLDIKDLNFSADNLLYNIDTIAASVKEASFKEKSGFVLNQFNADFLFTGDQTSLQNFYIKTPGTVLRNKAVITYPSLAQLAANPDLLSLDLNFESSSIQVKDILTFVPLLKAQPAFSNPSQTWMINGRVFGRISDLHFDDLRFRGFGNTTLFVTGSIKGLPDPAKLSADLDIKHFNTGRKDILSLLPANTLPANITLPETISASGTVKGNMNGLTSDLTINTSLGAARLNGSLQNFSNPKTARYDYAVNAIGINLGTIMGDPKTFGTLSGNFKIKGNGFDPNIANAKVNGLISAVGYNQYTYKNIKLDGGIANKNYTVNASVTDPNIDLDILASGAFNGKYPSVHLTANIDSIKAQPLHFTPQTLIYRGKIEGDFTNVDPDNLAGNFLVTNSILVNDTQRFELDTLELTADNAPGAKQLKFRSDFIALQIAGNYTLTQIADVFQQSIDPYFALTAKRNTAKVAPYDFTITGSVIDHPALKVFMPELKKLDPININAHFTSAGWNAGIDAPSILYGTLTLKGLKLTAETKNNQLAFNTSFNQLKNGTSVAVFQTTLDGTLLNNNLDFKLNIKDAQSKDKYAFAGLLNTPTLNNYSFKLKPEGLLLNYDTWSVNANNFISFINGDIAANQFVLNKGSEQLSINSEGATGKNRPLRIDFNNFQISTITGFFQSDSLLVNGTLNGNAVVKNIMIQPNFTTDLMVNDLSLFKDTLGNLSAKVNNNVANVYNAAVSLKGHGNEINLNGNYFLKPKNQSTYDFTLDMVALQLKSIEGLTQGAIRQSRGNLYGKVAFNGSIEKPNIDGQINFNEIAFNVTTLNSVFRVDKEAIAVVSNTGILLKTFTISDTVNNVINIDGEVLSSDFTNYKFDLSINATNFQAINSTKLDNRLFYGKLLFSTALTIKGTPTNPVIDGNLTVNDKTDFSVVLPQNDPSVVQREGIVRFVDMDATTEDSLFMAPYDSLKVSPLQGFDVTVNLNIDKNAIFNVIVDEGNGDFLRIKGVGQLTGGIDASGKVTMVGSYEISEGSYDLSFNFLKRKFSMQKGSKIVWTGEPTTADIDVTAIYIANTAPYDLLKAQNPGTDDRYRQKLPFEVHLTMRGSLLSPAITFNIVLPGDQNYNFDKSVITTIENKLIQMRLEPAEMNKQVFALLLLNRFVAENPFSNSGGGGGLDAGAFARQSVSKLLTEQLNQLAGDLIEGVDINFDVASTTSDYRTGEKAERTDFNVGLSKRLLSDRLVVTVGSNFELEGPQQTRGKAQKNNVAGNIAIDYKLSRSGRYMLRAYRKNNYEGAIEGYVIETGLGFIMSVDYNKFSQLFNRKKRKAERDARKQAAEDKQKIDNAVKASGNEISE